MPIDFTHPHIMGILNVTPDSFSDGGRFVARDQALERALRMVEEGASIIDIGGESTRPGATAVSVQQELDRVLPVIEALRSANIAALISIDTSKPEVMRAAVAAGAGMINDVYALRVPGALEAAAQLGVPVCLMHMQGEPRTMQSAPSYDDVFGEVSAFLDQRVSACIAAGIDIKNIVLDPGFGFGKALAHNLRLFNHLPDFCATGFPILVGVSRKSMFSALLNAPVEARLSATIACTALAVKAGARIIRVHDVKENMDAMRVAVALSELTP